MKRRKYVWPTRTKCIRHTPCADRQRHTESADRQRHTECAAYKGRGFTLCEALVAMLALSALTMLCLQFFAAQTDQRREVFARLTAAQEAANLLERVEALAWNDLTPASAAKLQLSAQARRSLPEPRVETLVDEPSGTPPARRVAVAVRWRPQRGGPEREVRLVAWRYKEP